MARGQSLQDPFLNALRKERVPVSIYLVNGIKLQGQIDSFDQFVVLLRNSVSQMVYKHAISTVVPARNVRLPTGEDGEVTEPASSNEPVERAKMNNVVERVVGQPLFDRPHGGERAVLVGVGIGRPVDPSDTAEFEALAASAGALRGRARSRQPARPDPKYFVGSGKAEEIRQAPTATRPTSSSSTRP